VKLRTEQIEQMRDARLDGFRRERLLDLRDRGYQVSSTSSSQETVVRDALGHESLVRSQGLRVEVQTPLGRRFVTVQHPSGRMACITDPAGNQVRFERTSEGRLTLIDRGEGSIYRFDIEANDRLRKLSYPDGTFTSIEHDLRGRPKRVTDRGGASILMRYTADGLPESIVDARGSCTSLEYGAWSLPREIAYPDGHCHGFEYDAVGSLTCMRVDGEVHAQFSRDGAAAKHEAQFADGTHACFILDGERLLEASNESGHIEFEYDESGRLVAETSNGATVRYRRNALGSIVALELPDGESIRYERDADQRLIGIVDWDGRRIQISLPAAGPPTDIHYPNGVRQVTSSSSLGLCSSWCLELPGGESLSRTFEYDTCGRLIASLEGEHRSNIRYDAAGRLVAVDAADPARCEHFSLDANGNRVEDNGGRAEFDAMNQLIRRGDTLYTYDARGNALSSTSTGQPRSYRWNGRNQLIEVDSPRGPIRFAYDALGRRIRKQSGSQVTEYVWAGAQLVAEITRVGSHTSRRDHLVSLDHPGAPWAIRDRDARGNSTHYLHAGRQHEVLYATDANGAIVWRATYRAFGEALSGDSSFHQPWRYAGHYHDDDTGLDYAGARYYVPELGRYLSRDPLLAEGGSLNFYTYCDGDPLNRIDPTGEIGGFLTACVIGAVAGAVVGAAIGAGIEMYRQRNEPRYDWGAIGKSALVGGAIGVVGGLVGAAAEVAAVAAVGVVAAGAIGGGIGAGVEYCADVAITDNEWSWGGFGRSVGIGIAIGAVTGGVGGILASRAARRAAREAAEELAEESLEEASEQVIKQAVPPPPKTQPKKVVVKKQPDGFKKNRKAIENSDKIQGQPEAVVEPHAAREVRAAEKVASRPDVDHVVMGEEADKLVNPTSKPGTQKSPDVVGVTKDGKYVLSEAKGADTDGALKQLDHAGKKLGTDKIKHQEIAVDGPDRLAPGYTTSPGGMLMCNGKQIRVNGKPVHVVFVGGE